MKSDIRRINSRCVTITEHEFCEMKKNKKKMKSKKLFMHIMLAVETHFLHHYLNTQNQLNNKRRGEQEKNHYHTAHTHTHTPYLPTNVSRVDYDLNISPIFVKRNPFFHSSVFDEFYQHLPLKKCFINFSFFGCFILSFVVY